MQKNIHNDKINHYIDRAEDAVMTAVDSVSQTYVDVLKQKGEFTEDSRKEAFDKAKEQALLMISEEGKNIITEVHGDVDVWLTNKIENYVKNNKRI
jgi:vacuolar-type H+-ATPase subunit H